MVGSESDKETKKMQNFHAMVGYLWSAKKKWKLWFWIWSRNCDGDVAAHTHTHTQFLFETVRWVQTKQRVKGWRLESVVNVVVVWKKREQKWEEGQKRNANYMNEISREWRFVPLTLYLSFMFFASSPCVLVFFLALLCCVIG